MKTEARYEMTQENTVEAIAMARASTPGCRWGSVARTEAEFQAALDAGIGDTVWCTWIPDPDPKSDETLFVGVTGNGPTSEANARFLAHARDIVIALGEEVLELRGKLAEIERTSPLPSGGRDG